MIIAVQYMAFHISLMLLSFVGLLKLSNAHPLSKIVIFFSLIEQEATTRSRIFGRYSNLIIYHPARS